MDGYGRQFGEKMTYSIGLTYGAALQSLRFSCFASNLAASAPLQASGFLLAASMVDCLALDKAVPHRSLSEGSASTQTTLL